MKLSYLDLMTTDPSYNLAMEQYVFDCLPRDRMYFCLLYTSPSPRDTR